MPGALSREPDQRPPPPLVTSRLAFLPNPLPFAHGWRAFKVRGESGEALLRGRPGAGQPPARRCPVSPGPRTSGPQRRPGRRSLPGALVLGSRGGPPGPSAPPRLACPALRGLGLPTVAAGRQCRCRGGASTGAGPARGGAGGGRGGARPGCADGGAGGGGAGRAGCDLLRARRVGGAQPLRDRRRRFQDSHGSRGADGGRGRAPGVGVPPAGRLPLVRTGHLRPLRAPDAGPARRREGGAAGASAEPPCGAHGAPAGAVGPAAPRARPRPDGPRRGPWPLSLRREHDRGRGAVDGPPAPGPHAREDQIREGRAAVGGRLGADGEADVPGQGHPALAAGAQGRHQGVPGASENLPSGRGREWEEVPGENAQRAVREPAAAGTREVPGVRRPRVCGRGRAAAGVRGRRAPGAVLRVHPRAAEVKREPAPFRGAAPRSLLLSFGLDFGAGPLKSPIKGWF